MIQTASVVTSFSNCRSPKILAYSSASSPYRMISDASSRSAVATALQVEMALQWGFRASLHVSPRVGGGCSMLSRCAAVHARPSPRKSAEAILLISDPPDAIMPAVHARGSERLVHTYAGPSLSLAETAFPAPPHNAPEVLRGVS